MAAACHHDGPSAPTVLVPPQNVTATQVSASSVMLSWSRVRGAQTYRIEKAEASAPTVFTVVSDTVKGTQFTVLRLTPGAEYRLRVSAQAGSVISAPSTEASIATTFATYLYGTTSRGGANGLGTIYRVDENGQNFSKVFDFTATTGGEPYGGLTLASDGRLYGFTTTEGALVNAGAALSFGSFFAFDPETNKLEVIRYIDDKSVLGQTFNDAPVVGADGLLYFASQTSYKDGFGGVDAISSTISSYNPDTKTFTSSLLKHFDYGTIQSQFLAASDVNLYVATAGGAKNGCGAVVRISVPAMQPTTLHNSRCYIITVSNDFEAPDNNPMFEVPLRTADGKRYIFGASRRGGTGFGTLFDLSIEGNGADFRIFQMLTNADVDAGIPGEAGWDPAGGFVFLNNKMWGQTAQRRVVNQNSGVILSRDFTVAGWPLRYEKTLDLEGRQCEGTFVASPNGRAYLQCTGGGTSNGSLIEFNPLNGVVTQRHAFSPSDGVKPRRNALAIVRQ